MLTQWALWVGIGAAGGLGVGLLLWLGQYRLTVQARRQAHELGEELAERNRDNDHLKDQLVEQERELIRAQAVHQAQLQSAQGLQDQLERNRKEMSLQFGQLAQAVLSQTTQHFKQTGEQSIEQLLKPLKTQIDAFQQRLNQVHSETVRDQAQLGAELRKVMEVGLQMSAEAKHLSQALKGDKKRMGTWGERLLAQTLEQMGLIAEQHYVAQPRYRSARGQTLIPDFVVYLPNEQHLVIDSKTSLVDYDRAMAADSAQEREQALNALAKAFERHIDDLASKSYHALPQLNSPDFVLMFVPLEPAYLAALSHQPSLFEYGLRKNIILTSHTSLVPIVKAIAQIWALAQSHEHAYALAQHAEAIFAQLDRLSERLRRVGDSISQLTNHYNNSVTALVGQQGVYAKLERFEALVPQREQQSVRQPQRLYPEIQSGRLQVGATEDDTNQSGY